MTERIIWGGRYAIHEELASGGMATVYVASRLGESTEIPRVVALKKLSAQFAKQPEFVAMFLDEAHLAARIRHPNVVATYEFLRTEEGLGIVMDLVLGESFVQLLRGDGPAPPLAVSIAILIDALEGLHAAHEAKDDTGRPLHLVHRDVSPHNIIVGADGVSRVIDFGIAKAAGRLQTTDVGVLKGKFAYMAPEQIHGAEVDRRTDVYAAGIVLWEASTGRKLFEGSSNEELLTQRMAGTLPVPPPSSVNSALSPGFDRLVLRALENDPGARYPSARGMADALRVLPCANAKEVAAWVVGCVGRKIESLEATIGALNGALAFTTVEGTSENAVQRTGTEGPLVPDLPERPRKPPPPAKTTSSQARARFGGDLDLEAESAAPDAPPALDLDLDGGALPPPPPNRPPAVDLERARPRPPRPPDAKRQSHPARLGFVLVLLVLIAGLGVVAALRGPAMMRSRVITGAAAYGFAVDVDHAELSRGALVLRGLRATLAGSRAFALTAAEVEVDVDRVGAPLKVTLSGYDLQCSGRASDLAAALAAWRKEPHAPLPVSARAGHIGWTGATIPGLVVEALDVSLNVAGSSDGAFTLDTGNLLVNLPRAHLGPWHAHVESTSAVSRARLGLDSSAADGPPSVTFIARPVEGSTWSVDIPRASTFKIGVPAQVFGVDSDLGIEVALRANVGASGETLTAEARVGLYGLRADSSRPASPIDLVISGDVEGNVSRPMPITGAKLLLGKTSSVVSGSLYVESDGIRVEIERPTGRGMQVPALVVDSRSWTSADGSPATPR